jgi:nicotinate dehydrogenase subunit A
VRLFHGAGRRRAEKSRGKPLWSVAPKTVVTVEVLGAGERPHPSRQALLDEQAGLGGDCLAGILVSAKALLDREPSPSRREVAEALDDTICRRGTHNGIPRGVLKGAGQRRDQVPA